MIPRNPTKLEVNEWLDAIFAQAGLENEDQYYNDATTAFENLTYYFLQLRLGSMPAFFKKMIANTRFDYVGVVAMLKRFQRDAFGVRRFDELVNSLVVAGKMDGEARATIITEVKRLGLRITAESPRKTREAAVFSLWMCVFRPVTFDVRAIPEIKPESLETFCAMLNFFITSSYLGKFGDIELGQTPKEKTIRAERIRHDFTCREVSLSSLEIFYGAIFKLLPEYVQHENTTVETSSFSKKITPDAAGR